jgi:dihydrodipicolinate synthase/N-acetylneuraminate lyase
MLRGATLTMTPDTQRALNSELQRIMNLLNDGKVVSTFKALEDLRTVLQTSVAPMDAHAKRERERVLCLKENIQTLVNAL